MKLGTKIVVGAVVGIAIGAAMICSIVGFTYLVMQ